MNFKDFIDDNFNDQDPTDLKDLIDFLEDYENQEKLFQFWNSLKNFKLQASISDKIFDGVIGKTWKSEYPL